MGFRFYTNAVSRASRNFAAGIFIVGLLLIGFGVVILALPEIFALLAAAVFFIAGLGCAVTALKVFMVHRHLDRVGRDSTDAHRENVQIHIEDHYDA
jgi:hypothetical protein